MSKLVALVFDDEYKAEEARAALHRMAGHSLLEVDETTLLARRQSGKLLMSQDVDVSKRGDAIGHVVGLVGAAVAGARPAGVTSAVAEQLLATLAADASASAFVKDLDRQLRPGTSALVVLSSSDQERARKVLDRMRGWNPKVLQADLPPELVRALDARLAHVSAPSDRKPTTT